MKQIKNIKIKFFCSHIKIDFCLEYKPKSFAPDPRAVSELLIEDNVYLRDFNQPIRPARIPYGLNGRGPNDECSFEPRWPIEIEVLNEPRIKHIDTAPKEPELFHKSSSFSFHKKTNTKTTRGNFRYRSRTYGTQLR